MSNQSVIFLGGAWSLGWDMMCYSGMKFMGFLKCVQPVVFLFRHCILLLIIKKKNNYNFMIV